MGLDAVTISLPGSISIGGRAVNKEVKVTLSQDNREAENAKGRKVNSPRLDISYTVPGKTSSGTESSYSISVSNWDDSICRFNWRPGDTIDCSYLTYDPSEEWSKENDLKGRVPSGEGVIEKEARQMLDGIKRTLLKDDMMDPSEKAGKLDTLKLYENFLKELIMGKAK